GNPYSQGNFFVDFALSAGFTSYPTNFSQLKPAGSLVYQGPGVTDAVVAAGDTPGYMLAVNTGETVSVAVTPSTGTLQPTVAVFNPLGQLLGIATASAAGQPVVLEVVPVLGAPQTNQTYVVVVSGAGNSVGLYTAQVTLNADLLTAAPQVPLS